MISDGNSPSRDLPATAVATNPTQVSNCAEDPNIGRQIGAYRIVSELGRGGMGSVYLAVRDDKEFRKQAAVKLIKRGMDTDEILPRFRQ
jgi:hypothetical protein